MQSREKILGRIRSQKNRDSLPKGEQDLLQQRIATHERNLIPKRAQIPLKDQIKLFKTKMESQMTTVTEVSNASEIPDIVKDYLASRNFPTRIKVSPSEEVSGLPWDKTPTLEIVEGAGAEEDEVGISPAFSGIAETGTLMMASGAKTPSTVNFLPENHIVVLDVNQMVGSIEESWDLLRSKTKGDVFPRTVNFISGPSKTADIEQRMVMGAHGPKTLHVILVGDGSEEG